MGLTEQLITIVMCVIGTVVPRCLAFLLFKPGKICRRIYDIWEGHFPPLFLPCWWFTALKMSALSVDPTGFRR